MELRTTRMFERFSTTVSKNKQQYAESDPTQADLHALQTINFRTVSAESALLTPTWMVVYNLF